MQVLLLLLLLHVSAGLAEDLTYGSAFRIWLQRRAQSLDFHPYDSGTVKLLWRRRPAHSRYRTFEDDDDYFVIKHVTPANSGLYRLKNRDNVTIHTSSLDVVPQQRYDTLTAGEYFSFDVDLPSSSCNIYHSSGSTSAVMKRGQLEHFFHDIDCSGIDMYESCGIVIESVQKGCGGKFTVRDGDSYEVMKVWLTVESAPVDVSKIGIGLGVSFAFSFCCCCMKKCCCGKKKKKKNEDETPEDEAAVQYQELDHEPSGPRSGHEALVAPETDLDPPAYSAALLVNNPPHVVMPPPYSEVTTGLEEPAEGRATVAPATFAPTTFAPTTFAPTTVPLSSDPEPRYQINFRFPTAAPLSSDTEFSSVYTSDKLNLGGAAASE